MQQYMIIINSLARITKRHTRFSTEHALFISAHPASTPLPLRCLPRLLPNTSVLDSPSHIRRPILDCVRQRLQAISDSFRAGRVIDCLAETAASGAYDAADGFA